MIFIIANVLFPIFLIVTCLGLGLFIKLLLKKEQNLSVSVAEGLAFLISIGYLITLNSYLPKFLPTSVFVLALIGIFTSTTIIKRLIQQKSHFLVLTFTYLCVSLPTFIYGKISWSGWVQLDDTATFLALTDRIMIAGQTLTTSLQSTFDRVIHVIFNNSFFGAYDAIANQQNFKYPIGSLIPVGTFGNLLSIDYAWIYFPYLLICVAITATLFYVVLTSYFKSNWQLLTAAIFSAQASTFYSYALWGGIKELTLVPIFLLNLIHLKQIFDSKKNLVKNPALIFRYLISSFAFYAVAGKSGFGYIVGSLFIYLYVKNAPKLINRIDFRIFSLLLLSAILSFWSLILKTVNRYLVPEIPDSGNFIRSLNPFQMLGVWPSGDFRNDIYWQPYSQLLLLTLLILCVFGIISSLKSKEYLIPVSAITSLLIVIYSHFFGGIWLTGKAIAVASPFWLSATFIGIHNLDFKGVFKNFKKVGIVGLAIAVTTSNSLSISHAWFAPSEKLQELARIGKEFAGQGPALMTDYSVAGARYFLRYLSAESASELRVHSIPMRDGTELKKGFAADLDLFDNEVISKYKLLVLKHTAVGSRPLFNYELKYEGKYYDVWKLNELESLKIESIPLGNNFTPGGMPNCQTIQDLFSSNIKSIYAAVRAPTYTLSLNDATLPAKWRLPTDQNGSVIPVKRGVIQSIFEVKELASYEIFIGGSFGGELSIKIDGKEVYKANTFFEGNPYLSNYLTELELSAGKHLLELKYQDRFWRPGGSVIQPLGPLYLSQETAANAKITEFFPYDTQKLCKLNVDWLAWKVA